MDKFEKRLVVYTAYSKYYYFAKSLISSYVLENGFIPLNPFMNWEYFMNDMVDRDLVIRGNNNLIFLSNELWIFGPISDGVFEEVKLANCLGLKIRYFSVGKNLKDICPINRSDLVFEEELLSKYSFNDINKEFC